VIPAVDRYYRAVHTRAYRFCRDHYQIRMRLTGSEHDGLIAALIVARKNEKSLRQAIAVLARRLRALQRGVER